jgi:hypothetical protein
MAISDRNAASITVFADEAAAYLAEALYLGNLGIKAIANTHHNQAIFDAARNLVETHQLRYKMGVRLTKQDYAPLQKALQNHPGYGKTDPKQMAGCGGVAKRP